MRLISFPPTKPRKSKCPPWWRTIGLPTGTVAENNGIVWVLLQDGDLYGTWRWWEPVPGSTMEEQ